MRSIQAAFRFAIFVLLTLALYAVWWVGTIFVSDRAGWRKWAFRSWSKAFARIAGMKIVTHGEPPEPPFFLVSNHIGYMDIPVLNITANGVFVAKSEIANWPVAGPIVGNMGVVFIDRTNRRDIPRAGSQIIERLDANEGVILFPEGTSTKGEEVLPFNSSFLAFASQSGLRVSYATLVYETPPGGPTPAESVCWWDDKSFGRHLFELFKLPRFTAVITFGEEPVQNSDRKALAIELRDKIVSNFTPMD